MTETNMRPSQKDAFPNPYTGIKKISRIIIILIEFYFEFFMLGGWPVDSRTALQ